jgi:hypothetical protein
MLRVHRGVLAAALLSFGHAAIAQSTFGFKPGEAGAPVTGGAGPGGSVNAAPTLEKCDAPMGTIAVVEPQSEVMAALARYNLPPPTSLLRLMIQQSNCFQVVERGLAMQNLMQERNLAASGQLQAGSNVGQGQMVTADFVMTPQVAFSENNAGGAGIAAIGSLFGALGSVVGAVAAGVKFKQAQTTLLVADARSGIQVAAAEGNVEKADWGVGGFLGGVGAGAYTNTAEGKVVAAALLDNYNNIVKSIRAQPSLIAARAGAASVANAAASVQAPQPKPPGAFGSGDVIVPKIAGVRVFAGPASTSKPVLTLKKGDEMVYLGEDKESFIRVQTSSGAGWVDRNLVTGTR